METNYEKTADELTNRILSFIPNHPEILKMSDPFDFQDGRLYLCGFRAFLRSGMLVFR